MQNQVPLNHPIKRVNLSDQFYLKAGLSSMTVMAAIALYGVCCSGWFYLSVPVVACFAVTYVCLIKLINSMWRMPKSPETKAFQVNKYYPELMENEL